MGTAHNVDAVIIPADDLASAIFGIPVNDKPPAVAGLDAPTLLSTLLNVAQGSKLVRELGLTGGYYLKEANGRTYVILTGARDLRPFLRGTKYLLANPLVGRMGIGPIAEGVAGRSNFIFAMTMYTVEDVRKFIFDEDFTWDQLAGNALWNGVSTYLTIEGIALATTYAASAGLFTVAWPGILGGIVLGVGMSYLSNSLNNEFRISSNLALALRSTANALAWGEIKAGQVVKDAQDKYDPTGKFPPSESSQWEPDDDWNGILIDIFPGWDGPGYTLDNQPYLEPEKEKENEEKQTGGSS